MENSSKTTAVESYGLFFHKDSSVKYIRKVWQILPPPLPLIGLNFRFSQKGTIKPDYNAHCIRSNVIENLTLQDTFNLQKQRLYVEHVDKKRMKKSVCKIFLL